MRGGRAPLVAALLALVAQLLGGAAVAQEAAATPAARPRPKGAGIEIGTLGFVDREIQRAELPAKAEWRKLREGDPLRTGDSFRTAPDATARLDFPWMGVTLGGSTLLTIPASTVLSTVLEQGRGEFAGPGRDLVKIQFGEGGEVRGGGRLVLWRSVGRTSAAALEGRFRVRAAGRTVEIAAGQGTVVLDGRRPEAAVALPAAPSGLEPGDDPLYVRSGQTAELRWDGETTAPGHHVEVLAFDRDLVLMARDVGAPGASSVRVELPWPGTFRWRVAARDAHGLESLPSSTGLVCSVER